MLKIAKTEFHKLKRYSVVWIGVATMLTVVLLTRFMATASDGAGTGSWCSNLGRSTV